MKIVVSTTPTSARLTCEIATGPFHTMTPNGAAVAVQEAVEQFRDTLTNLIDLTREGTSARDLLPAPSLNPSGTCKGCGTAVGPSVRLCPACEHKGYLVPPRATIALANQGEPVYKREGNFRDLPTEREVQE